MPDRKQPDLTPPAGVAKAAERGLKLREKFNRGGTEVGVRRAHQLMRRDPVSEADIVDISSYFARHSVEDAKSTEW